MTNENVISRRSDASTQRLPERGSPPPLGFPAQHAGTCPICSKYIRPNVSLIASLDVPLPPDPTTLYRKSRTWLGMDGRAADVRPRAWVHARCLSRAGDADEQAMLADERREELARLAVVADETEFPCARRRRR